MAGTTVMLYWDTLMQYIDVAFFLIEARFLRFTAPVTYNFFNND